MKIKKINKIYHEIIETDKDMYKREFEIGSDYV